MIDLPPLKEADIYAAVAAEVSHGNLHDACLEDAKANSQGDEERVILVYFSKRIEMLRAENYEDVDLAADADVGQAAAIVRYRSTTNCEITREDKARFYSLFSRFFGNFILVLSSVSVWVAVLTLQGYTVQILPYWLISGGVALSLMIPYLCSKVVFRGCAVSYQTYLSVFCVLFSMGSVMSGVLLMKKDPNNYELLSDSSNSVDGELGDGEVLIILEPSRSASSLVLEPTF